MRSRCKIQISGTSFHAACDPRISSVPKEEDWPEPVVSRRGRGVTVTYTGDVDLAEAIASHMRQVGEGFAYGDAETRSDGRSLVRDAAKIERLIESHAIQT